MEQHEQGEIVEQLREQCENFSPHTGISSEEGDQIARSTKRIKKMAVKMYKALHQLKQQRIWNVKLGLSLIKIL